MYIAAHAYSVAGQDEEESQKRLTELLAWAAQDKYKISLSWHDPGDLMIWDNTCVMHRATVSACLSGTDSKIYLLMLKVNVDIAGRGFRRQIPARLSAVHCSRHEHASLGLK